MPLNMVVCVKQIPDPETPPAQFRIDTATNKVVPPAGVAPVVSQFDEVAVEAALQLKEKHGGKITVISMGAESARDVIKHALSMGADEGVLLNDPAFEDPDAVMTAYVLTQAIKKVGEVDLVLCGRQAADWDQGIVGLGIASYLDLPAITICRKVEVNDSTVRAERVITDGYEVFESSLPAVVTLSNEFGVPRYPTLRLIMAAAKKPVSIWSAADIGADPNRIGAQGRYNKLQRLFVPEVESKVEYIEAETPADAGIALALRLRAEKLI